MNGLIGLHNMIKDESVRDDMNVIQLEALQNMDIRDNFISTFGIMDDAYEAVNTRPTAPASHNKPSMNSADLNKPDNQNPNNKNGGKVGGSGVDDGSSDDDLYTKDSSTSEGFMDFEDLMEAVTADADDAEDDIDDTTEADDADVDDEDVPELDAETKEALEMIPEASDEEVVEFWHATEDPDSFEARTVIEAELAGLDMIDDDF